MRNKTFKQSLLALALLFAANIIIKAAPAPSLSPGDIAFTAFNADGNDNFAIVVLSELPADTAIYFTDNEPDIGGGLTDMNEGILKWHTGSSPIPEGTIVVFDSVAISDKKVSTGTIESVSGTMNLSASGDALFAYVGNSYNDISVWLAGIQNSSGNEGSGFSTTGLTSGLTFIDFYTSGTPDGGYYSGTRNNKASFNEYLSEIGNNANWTTETTDGELILPIATDPFSIIIPIFSDITTDKQSYIAGDTVIFQWGAANTDSVSVFVYIPDNGQWSPVGNFLNDGMDSIAIPGNATYSNMYKIKVAIQADTSVNNISETFTIIENPDYQPSISIKAAEILKPAIMMDADSSIIFDGADSIFVSGKNLKSQITLTAPERLQLSLSMNGPYSDTVRINKSDGSIADVKVYIKVNSNDLSFVNFDSVIITSKDADTVYRALSATKAFYISIKTIQEPVTGDASPYNGQYVYTKGVVTASANNSYFMQDVTETTAEYTGILVDNNGNTVNVNEESYLHTLGKVAEIDGMTTILYNYHELDKNSPTLYYSASTITTNSANSEAYESVFVKVENATCSGEANINNEWLVNDGSGSLMVNDNLYNYTPDAGKTYNIQGIIGYSNGTFSINPREANDVEALTSTESLETTIVNIYPNPATEIINIESPDIISNVSVLSASGVLINKFTISETKTSVNISDYTPGVYMLSVESESDIIHFSFIKE